MFSFMCLTFLLGGTRSYGFLPRFSGFGISGKPTNLLSSPDDQQPPNGFPENLNGKSNLQQSKADLYSNEELQNLLSLHQTVEENGGFGNSYVDSNSRNKLDNDSPISIGLHDMVLQTLEDMKIPDHEEEETFVTDRTSASSSSSYSLTENKRSTLGNIRAIASDVDGTLISSNQTVHPITQSAIKRALTEVKSPDKTLQHFFLATGKTRKALQSLGPELSPLLQKCAGVFVQGLYCVNAQGEVIYEERLGLVEANIVIQFGEARGLSVLAYDGDQIFTTSRANPQHVRDVHEVWGEPRPVLVDSLLDYRPGYHKCLLWSDDTNAINNEVRPHLEQIALDNNGSVTQAIPTMLEFLPRGASKAKGVQKLCDYLGIRMGEELLAIGDAENDIGFLQDSAFGVAVGNGVPKVKNAADLVLYETNDQGGAGVAINLFGLGDALG